VSEESEGSFSCSVATSLSARPVEVMMSPMPRVYCCGVAISERDVDGAHFECSTDVSMGSQFGVLTWLGLLSLLRSITP